MDKFACVCVCVCVFNAYFPVCNAYFKMFNNTDNQLDATIMV